MKSYGKTHMTYSRHPIGVDFDHYKSLQWLTEKYGNSIKFYAHKAIDLLMEKESRGELNESDPIVDEFITGIENDTRILNALLPAWRSAFPDEEPRTLSAVLAVIKDRTSCSSPDHNYENLKLILSEIDGSGDGRINKFRLANKLPLNNNGSDIVGGLRMRTVVNRKNRTKLYWVEEAIHG